MTSCSDSPTRKKTCELACGSVLDGATRMDKWRGVRVWKKRRKERVRDVEGPLYKVRMEDCIGFLREISYSPPRGLYFESMEKLSNGRLIYCFCIRLE